MQALIVVNKHIYAAVSSSVFGRNAAAHGLPFAQADRPVLLVKPSAKLTKSKPSTFVSCPPIAAFRLLLW